jgi:hypothetical protein
VLTKCSILLTALAAVAAVGCATYRCESKQFLPGADADVMAAKAAMTESNAVVLIGKYIRDYVDPPKEPSSSFAAALQKGMGRQLTITSTGFSYTVTSTYQVEGRMTVNISRKDVKFADVTKVEIEYWGRGDGMKPFDITLYDRKRNPVLRCPVRDSEEMIPRVLAAIEILCPNIGKTESAGAVAAGVK